jgi:hypothetical protein
MYSAHPQVSALVGLLDDKSCRNLFLKGLNGSGAALTIASLFFKKRGSYVCVLNDQEEAGYFYHDLMQLTNSQDIFSFPQLTGVPSSTDTSIRPTRFCVPRC